MVMVRIELHRDKQPLDLRRHQQEPEKVMPIGNNDTIDRKTMANTHKLLHKMDTPIPSVCYKNDSKTSCRPGLLDCVESLVCCIVYVANQTVSITMVCGVTGVTEACQNISHCCTHHTHTHTQRVAEHGCLPTTTILSTSSSSWHTNHYRETNKNRKQQTTRQLTPRQGNFLVKQKVGSHKVERLSTGIQGPIDALIDTGILSHNRTRHLLDLRIIIVVGSGSSPFVLVVGSSRSCRSNWCWWWRAFGGQW